MFQKIDRKGKRRCKKTSAMRETKEYCPPPTRNRGVEKKLTFKRGKNGDKNGRIKSWQREGESCASSSD